MKVLVTGGSGFIGSQLIHRWVLCHPGYEITNLDRLTYAAFGGRLAALDTVQSVRFIHGDVCAPAVVREALRGIDVVIHGAAETHVDRSITNAAPFVRTNVEGTQVLLEAARIARVHRFIHISTDEVYGPVLAGAVDERAPMAPKSPYAASKAAGDLLAQAHIATFGLPAIIVRPTNVYGLAQLPEKFIPLCITNAIQDIPIPLYGDGQQRRSWLAVEDLCEALDVIVQQGTIGEIYNIGSGHEQSNLETAKQILSVLGKSEALIRFTADRPGHDRRYAMDDAKLRALGWKPRISFDDGLRDTIAWYRKGRELWQPLTERLREDPYHWLDRPARPGAHEASRAPR